MKVHDLTKDRIILALSSVETKDGMRLGRSVFQIPFQLLPTIPHKAAGPPRYITLHFRL